jgi:hypothetical protein
VSSAPESILETKDQLSWNGDLNNPNDSEDDCAANIDSDTWQHNAIEDPEFPEQPNVSIAPNVPGLIRHSQKSMSHAKKVLVMVNAIETRRNKGLTKSRTQCISVSPASFCILTERFCYRYIMGEWWTVACEYPVINRYIAAQ